MDCAGDHDIPGCVNAEVPGRHREGCARLYLDASAGIYLDAGPKQIQEARAAVAGRGLQPHAIRIDQDARLLHIGVVRRGLCMGYQQLDLRVCQLQRAHPLLHAQEARFHRAHAGQDAVRGPVQFGGLGNGLAVVPPPRLCGGFPQGGAVFRLGRFRRNQVQEVEERSVFGGQARPDHFRRDAGIVVADLFRGEFELGEHVFDDYWMNYLTQDMASNIAAKMYM